ncbi:hypothetical protein CFC21_112636 [Triticum aestivum]|uniref:Late embryogenesis abundant protein LEA-2 subgroup domain-containing protein n=2 Tax=Triticum aestivum TaxID=4565 RepID=A0A9R0G570_WHEAT|nr:uncharacterized protein LOC123064852 [Triticum aestivum]MBC2899820.1 hypothetical protein [Triticum aestivum]CDM81350.1 unnamed protein product [Triticum aestivum]
MCCSECGCYDAFCDSCCPCVSYDAREAILCCAACLAVLAGAVLLAVLLAAYGFIRHAEVTVRDASLTRLALAVSPATAFAYNLSLTLTVRNKNWAMSVKNTKPLEAHYSFDGQSFERIRLAEEGFTQPPDDTQVYHLVSGDDGRYVALGNAGVAEFKAGNATGVFKVEVAVSGEVRYQAHYTKCKFEAKCPLVLQLAPPGTPAVVFQGVKCKPVTANKNC